MEREWEEEGKNENECSLKELASSPSHQPDTDRRYYDSSSERARSPSSQNCEDSVFYKLFSWNTSAFKSSPCDAVAGTIDYGGNYWLKMLGVVRRHYTFPWKLRVRMSVAAAAYARACSSDKHPDTRQLWVGLSGSHFQITAHYFS